MRHPILAPLLLAALAACAGLPGTTPGGGGPVAGETPRPPAEVQDMLAAELRDRGFLVATEPALVRAEIPTGAPAEWVSCERISVEDEQSIVKRYAWADPVTRRIWLEARIEPSGAGSRVVLSPFLEGIYKDPFTNLEQREPCTSTGQLEALLFRAIGAS